MTLDEYVDFITRVLLNEADGFEGMTYGEAYYQPMAEVVEYLQDNGFKCYVVSGSDRFIVRTFIQELESELKNEKRKFCFLCAHDVTVYSTLCALGVEPYTLPDSMR